MDLTSEMSHPAAAAIVAALIANRYDEELGADGVAEVANIALAALATAGYVPPSLDPNQPRTPGGEQ